MPNVGVTGHVDLPPEAVEHILADLTRRLSHAVARGWDGVTCLARGADQLFATAILQVDGKFRVVLPAADYVHRMIAAGHQQPFLKLLDSAAGVDTMGFETSSRAAYLAASEEMLDRCEMILAVWDGRDSRAVGDTADVVRRARARNLDVQVVWPAEPQAAELVGTSPVTSQPSAPT